MFFHAILKLFTQNRLVGVLYDFIINTNTLYSYSGIQCKYMWQIVFRRVIVKITIS
jgi:hypothetical protein